MINPIDVMGDDNSPTIINSSNLDKRTELDAEALRLNIDLLSAQKSVIIDGTSFTRFNAGTGTSYTSSWDNLHLRLLHTIAVQPNPNPTTMSIQNKLRLTSGTLRNFDLSMPGSNAEASSTGQLLLTSADTMNLQTSNTADITISPAGSLSLAPSSATILTNGATIDTGSGNITELSSITGVPSAPLTINNTGAGGNVEINTNTTFITKVDDNGDIEQTNNTNYNDPVGSVITGGVRGQQLAVSGGSVGYGDFILYTFLVGSINDGRGHNLTRGLGLGNPALVNWGRNSNPLYAPPGNGMIQSFGCRMVATLPDSNTFICPFILGDLPSGNAPEINYSRITYYGNSNTNPIWVNEGSGSVQAPALQVNRFFGNSQITIEWSCSLVRNNPTSGLLSPLTYKVSVIGIDSSQEVLRAEAVCNWKLHPVPQSNAYYPVIAYENVGSDFHSIQSAEFWSNGCPFGL